MLTQYVALVSTVPSVALAQLTDVSAALQKQVERDLKSVWGVGAIVSAFASLESVPIGYWPIILVPQLQGASGVHLDRSGQPYALLDEGPNWSLTASHECLEMLVDPFGNRLVAGPSPVDPARRVEFLVEVCDPSEAAKFAYTVNGVIVSDFYTPHYFDPVQASGVRYSFTGAISAPRQVLPGGYLSWHDPIDGHWHQLQRGATGQVVRDLGVFPGQGSSLRSWIDRHTPRTRTATPGTVSARAQSSFDRAGSSARTASAARARSISEAVAMLTPPPVGSGDPGSALVAPRAGRTTRPRTL